MSRKWIAKWIGPEKRDQFHPVIFKDFYIDNQIKKATLYITSLGLFEAYINGQRVSEEYLMPYQKEFDNGLQYYTYDVTNLLNCGPDSEANAVDVFLGKGWGNLPDNRFALKAEFAIEVYKDQPGEEADADDDALLEELLDDEAFEEEVFEEIDGTLEKVELLSMRGNRRIRRGGNQPVELDDLGDLDDFLERVIDDPQEKRNGMPSAKRHSAQFFSMTETADPEMDEAQAETVKEDLAEDVKTAAVEAAQTEEPEEDFEMDIFDFEDLEEVLDSEKENGADGLPEKETHVDEEADDPALDETLSALADDVADESASDDSADLSETEAYETDVFEEVTDQSGQEEETELASEEFSEEESGRPEAKLDVTPYSITDEELEALFNDNVVDGTEEKGQEEQEDFVLPDIEEFLDDEELADEEPADQETAELDENIEEIAAAETEELAEEAAEKTEELAEEAAAETEELTEEAAEKTEELAEEAAAETAELAEEAAAAETAEAIEEAAEETTAEAEQTVPAGPVTLVGGLPFVMNQGNETDGAEAGVTAAVDGDFTDAVDGVVHEEAAALAADGTLVGGLPLAAGSEVGKASDAVVQEWSEAAQSDDADRDADLVGGLPFAVDNNSEAVIDKDLTEAVDNVVKNEEENIASEGQLVGGLSITPAALEGLAGKPEEEIPAAAAGTVTLVGGLPFVMNQAGHTEDAPVKAAVNDQFTEAVDGVIKEEADALAADGTLVGGLPLAAGSEVGKASDDVVQEWSEASQSDQPDLDADLVGGLPFAMVHKAEAIVGKGLTDAVDNVAKNEDANIASEGELVGGLSITSAALEGLTEKPDEVSAAEPEVILVGGLPFVVSEENKGHEEQATAVVEDQLSDAVDSIVKKEKRIAAGGKLIGGLPFDPESDTETIYIGTDKTWGYYASDIESGSFQEGEVFNRLLWNQDNNPEKNVEELDLDIRLTDRYDLPIIVKEQLEVSELQLTEEGDWILDFGHEFSGFVSFDSSLPAGTRVEFTFGTLSEDGSFCSDNSGGSFVYVSDGMEEYVAPHFTCFSGRYVKLSGWPGEPAADHFTGCVLYADLERTGYLETANEKLNEKYQNALWKQKRHSVAVPENCTLKDVSVFAPMASYNMNIKVFLENYFRRRKNRKAGTMDADVAFILWNLYEMYGDEKILAENYDLMKSWVDGVSEADAERGERHYLYDFQDDFTSILEDEEDTDHYFLASAYYYGSAEIVSKTAAVLGRTEDAAEYGRLARKIKNAFMEEYYTPTGRLSIDTQSAYIAALGFGLYIYKDRVLAAFRERFKKDGHRTSGGSGAMAYYCRTLAENGLYDLAYDVLLDETAETGNSEVEFLYACVAGIRPEKPGFEEIRIAPVPDGRVRECMCSYKSVAGHIIANWLLNDDGSLVFHFEIPKNTMAVIELPYYPVCAAGGNTIRVKGGIYDYSYMPSVNLLPDEKESEEA